LPFARTSFFLTLFLGLAFELLIHAGEIAVQRLDGNLLCHYIGIEAGRFSSLAVHGEDLINAVDV